MPDRCTPELPKDRSRGSAGLRTCPEVRSKGSIPTCRSEPVTPNGRDTSPSRQRLHKIAKVAGSPRSAIFGKFVQSLNEPSSCMHRSLASRSAARPANKNYTKIVLDIVLQNRTIASLGSRVITGNCKAMVNSPSGYGLAHEQRNREMGEHVRHRQREPAIVLGRRQTLASKDVPPVTRRGPRPDSTRRVSCQTASPSGALVRVGDQRGQKPGHRDQRQQSSPDRRAKAKT